MKRTIVFTGGGTAGHVYPGLSVAEELKNKDKDIEIIWIGSSNGMEADIVKEAGIEYAGIPSGKLRRYFSLRNFTDLFKIAAGLIKAFFLLRRIRPAMVFSKGGFVTVPPVAAAGLLKIPVFTHESDLTPGLATRINSRFAEKVLVSYEKTASFFPASQAEVTGNPVRRAVLEGDPAAGRSLCGAGGRRIILVIGGSQGALQINLLMKELAPELASKYFVIHQMGSYSYEDYGIDGYVNRDFIRGELPDFIAASDLIISRAGASTRWESASLGKPAILIPLGSGSSRGDQIRNAEIFEQAGAAVVMRGDVDAAALGGEIERLMADEECRKRMGRAALDVVRGNPAVTISDLIKARLDK